MSADPSPGDPQSMTDLEQKLRADRDELRERVAELESLIGPTECARDEYRAACNAVAHERDTAVRELADALNELRDLRAHRCGLPSSVVEALNSGDGTYRP